MLTIWKFTLQWQDGHEVEMPVGSEVLAVQIQHGAPTIWAKVPREHSKTERRRFVLVATGGTVTEDAHDYIGTVQAADGHLVFHLFELLNTGWGSDS